MVLMKLSLTEVAVVNVEEGNRGRAEDRPALF